MEERRQIEDGRNNSGIILDIFHKSNVCTQNKDKITTHIFS